MATTVQFRKTLKIREETQAIIEVKPKLMSSKPKTNRFIQKVVPKQPQPYAGVPKLPVFNMDKIAKKNFH